MPEPLPDFPLGFQVAWMIDPFTAANGATRIVPCSHLTRSKPSWKRGDRSEEKALCGGAGAVAIWLASTWHRVGPNATDRPRRAIISFYQRSWIKPFSDYRCSISPERARRMSPGARYLYGFSANGLRRG
jgi:ectoine hydroxylase-related dioxygenase (phytanoyl-CoA dioxygenase family)